MPKIGVGTLVIWQDGQDVDAVDINRNFEVLRTALNATSDVADNATNTVDAKVAIVQNDLNNKYGILVQADEDIVDEIARQATSLQLNIDMLSTHTDMQLSMRPTSSQMTQAISDAVATVVAGNSIIPVGNSLPPAGIGRVDGEEYILNDGVRRTLYIYNGSTEMWEKAANVVGVDAPTTTQFNEFKQQSAEALSNHVNNSTVHVTQADKNKWNNPPAGWLPEDNLYMELGQRRASSGVSFIDIHSNPGTDFDGRIIVSSDKTMELQASKVIASSGTNSLDLSRLRFNNNVLEHYDGTKWVSTMGTSVVTSANGILQYEMTDTVTRTGGIWYNSAGNANSGLSVLILNHIVPAAGEVTITFDFSFDAAGANRWSKCVLFAGDKQDDSGKHEFTNSSGYGQTNSFDAVTITDNYLPAPINDVRYHHLLINDTFGGWRSTGINMKVLRAGSIQVIFSGQKSENYDPNFSFRNVRVFYRKL